MNIDLISVEANDSFIIESCETEIPRYDQLDNIKLSCDGLCMSLFMVVYLLCQTNCHPRTEKSRWQIIAFSVFCIIQKTR